MITPEARAKAVANRDYVEISRKRVLNTDYTKIAEASERVVSQYNIKGDLVTDWKSIAAACKTIPKLHSANVVKCCNNERKTTAGFIWKYKIINT